MIWDKIGQINHFRWDSIFSFEIESILNPDSLLPVTIFFELVPCVWQRQSLDFWLFSDSISSICCSSVCLNLSISSYCCLNKKEITLIIFSVVLFYADIFPLPLMAPICSIFCWLLYLQEVRFLLGTLCSGYWIKLFLGCIFREYQAFRSRVLIDAQSHS